MAGTQIIANQAGDAISHERNVEQRIPMSYADYLTNFDDSTHVEWANGEAIVFMPPTIRHQDISIFLSALINSFVKTYELGKVLASPYEMRLLLTESSREPDILFVATANLSRVSAKRIDGPADLVVELISNDSVARDRGEKFYEYQANSIREYWVIDPRPKVARADFWVLDDNGTFQPVPMDVNGMYHSTVLPNFTLNVPQLLTDEELDPIQALIDMIGLDEINRKRNQRG